VRDITESEVGNSSSYLQNINYIVIITCYLTGSFSCRNCGYGGEINSKWETEYFTIKNVIDSYII